MIDQIFKVMAGPTAARSIQHHTMIEDSSVNRLLAPNSVERTDRRDGRGGSAQSRAPPTTSFEMYQRLVELLRIEQLPKQLAAAHRDDPDHPPPEWLTIRRPILAAPLFEELQSRAFILQALSSVVSVRTALLAQGFLFGAQHLQVRRVRMRGWEREDAVADPSSPLCRVHGTMLS